jgi:hypothetical protein
MDRNADLQAEQTPTRRVVRTWVGQFSIVAGEAQEAGPCLGLFQGNRADGEPVDLFVLVQPVTPGAEAYAQQVIDSIAERFQQEHLSMTGGLVRAVRAAHDTLLDWNRKSLREHQACLGLTCLAVRHEFAYLAQAGPSLAYVWSGDALARLTPELDEAVAPLGTEQPFYPEVQRIELHDGTMLLLASPILDTLVPASAMAEIFKRGPEESVMDLYARTRHLSDFSLVLIAATEEDVRETDLPPALAPSVAAPPSPAASPRSGAPGPDGREARRPPSPPVISTAPPVDERPPQAPPTARPAAPAPSVLIDDYAYTEAGEQHGSGGAGAPAVAYARPAERRNGEETLAQRLRRFFGVEEQPEEPVQPTPGPAAAPPPSRDHAVAPERDPLPRADIPRASFPRDRDVQRLPAIGLEPDRWQMLIDRLARLGWPVLALGALVIVALLIGAWCVIL